MATYQHPGVYVEELPSGSKPIEAVGTSTACFIGFATKGPMDEPTLISSWNQYDQLFGGLQATEGDVGASNKMGDAMGYGVYAFFQNGGAKAYIVRSARTGSAGEAEDGTDPTEAVAASVTLTDGAAVPTTLISITAVAEGTAGDDTVVIISEDADVAGVYDVIVRPVGSPDSEYNNVKLASADVADADYIETRMSADPRVSVVVGDGDLLVTAITDGGGSLTFTLSGGVDYDPGTPASDAVQGAAKATGIYLDSDNAYVTFSAINEGEWGNDLTVVITDPNPNAIAEASPEDDPQTLRSRYTVEIGTGSGEDFEAQEIFEDVSLTDGDTAVLVNKVDDIAELVSVTATSYQELVDAIAAANYNRIEITFSGGDNGEEPSQDEYDAVFSQLLKYRDINMILLPGCYWDDGAGKAIIEAGIAHCETIKNRMILVDLDPAMEFGNGKAVKDINLPTQTYAVTYYPWVLVSNSAYDVDLNPGAAQRLLVAPSGFAAGMWAKTDSRRGVWKAPAGVESGLLGVSELQYKVENPEQDYLNPLGVNALRQIPGYGPVIWGSRTLATKTKPEWRYLPVRRTAMFIEESLYNGIQWAVFEPNNHRLWSSLRTNIESFMNGLFRAGAFQGEKASDAYFVRCALGDTMTQGDIDRGQVIVIVGFAPVKPAEFVIVRLQQIVGQQ